MTTRPCDAVSDDGAPFSIEHGPDGRTVVFRIHGQERREPFADFVAAERRHARALRRAALDRAATELAHALGRAGLRLRRRLFVAVGRTLQSLPATQRAPATRAGGA
jgi:hypothetical protein